MNKCLWPLSIVLLLSYSVKAQYYYKDVVTNNQVFQDLSHYRDNKVRTVKINSFEDDGTPSEGFYCEKKISKDYKRIELYSKSSISAPSEFTSYFNEKGRLVKTIDSSTLASSTNLYFYDNKDRLTNVISVVRLSDDDFVNEIIEEHHYVYNDAGLPTKMTVLKNKKDQTEILFMTDEKGNLSIEKNTKTGSKYYYYYDSSNRLTDIVHSDEHTEKMLPDYMFEYNETGKLSQMITTEEGNSNYFIWRYTYEKGLRSAEKCYSKEKRLMGSLVYEYK